MLYSLGRLLQTISLFLILPAVLMGQALERIDVRTMYWGCGAGVLIFTVGWLLQELGKKRG